MTKQTRPIGPDGFKYRSSHSMAPDYLAKKFAKIRREMASTVIEEQVATREVQSTSSTVRLFKPTRKM